MRPRILGFLLLSLWICTPMAHAAQPLEVRIEHVEVLPSVSEELQPGKRFSLQLLQDDVQNNDWIKLPNWMCGTFRLKNETAVLRRDFKKNETITKPYTFSVKQTIRYGMQQDRMGGIWHYIGTPYHSKTALMDFDEYHLVTEKKFIRNDVMGVTFRTLMKAIRVNQYDRKIKEVFQQESITSYSPISEEPDFIHLSASTKSFDAAGSPSRQTDNEAKIRREKPYAEVKHFEGKNMRELFRQYLISQGMSNLLPD